MILELDHQTHFVGRIRIVDGIILGDLTFLVQVLQGLVECLHTLLTGLLHQVLELVHLTFANHVSGKWSVDQYLDRYTTPLAIRGGKQLLRNDRLEVQ